MFKILKIYVIFTIIYPFPEQMKTEKIEKLVASLRDNEEYVKHLMFKTSIKSWISIEKTS